MSRERGGRRGTHGGRHERDPKGGERDGRKEHHASRDRGAPADGAAHTNLAYGIHAVRTLLLHHAQRVRQVWLGSAIETSSRLQELHQLAEMARVPVRLAADDELDRLASGERHQGAVAQTVPRAGDPETQLEEALEAAGDVPPLLLVLDGVTDPHNLGACMRSADAAGVAAVIVPRDRAAGLTPVVHKVAAGAAETVPLVAVVNLARALRELKQRGFWLVGTADDATRTLWDIDLTGPTVLVLGSEGEGMRRLTREACDQLVSIPMAGAVESLNVSVATGVALFEAVRQRRAKRDAGSG
jgi:rRNA methylase, putative, group 3